MIKSARLPVPIQLLRAFLALFLSSFAAAQVIVPQFPSSLVVFPNRDFITVEDFSDRGPPEVTPGQKGLVEVRRKIQRVDQTVDVQIVGSATGIVSGGDIAFEINHPGGSCWGDGTGLKVTPNIVAGDEVFLFFDDGQAAITPVLNVSVFEGIPERTGNTVVVRGTVGADVLNKNFMESRIVNPDFDGTSVGRRDVRAIWGPLTDEPDGGYRSGLELDPLDPTGTTWKATYEFNDAAAAAIAARGGTGALIMAWNTEDPAGNPQQLTIAEAGESGGPGMGGCPAGPGDLPAPVGSARVVRSANKLSYAVSWTPVEAAPGAAAVTGYSVLAVSQTAIPASTDLAQTGLRVSASTPGVTINVPDTSDYTIEVRSLAGPRMSEPFPITTPTSTDPGGGTDITAPEVTASPPPQGTTVVQTSQVELSTEPGALIFFTTDGSPPYVNGMPAAKAELYTAPIKITQENTMLSWAAWDSASNFMPDLGGVYSPPTASTQPGPAPTPLPDTGTSSGSQATANSVTMRWAPPVGATPESYVVRLFSISPTSPPTRDPVMLPNTNNPNRTTRGTALSVSPLYPLLGYTFEVAGVYNGKEGDIGTFDGVLRPTDAITVTNRWRSRDFRISITGSLGSATMKVTVKASTGVDVVVAQNAPLVTTPGLAGGTLDLRPSGFNTQPQSITVESSARGRKTVPITVD